MSEIKVIVAGICGKMGKEVVRAISDETDIKLVGGIDKINIGKDIGIVSGIGELNLFISADMEELCDKEKPDVLIDFTISAGLFERLKYALSSGIKIVCGTTGINEDDINKIVAISQERKVGGIIAANFALGAVLMINFSKIAAKYFPDVEILEFHHEQKIDYPSGTALHTAREIIKSNKAEERRAVSLHSDNSAIAKLDNCRGGDLDGVKIHSVRLPGFVADQEVLFGGRGQVLSIKHSTISRESFMPGVIHAVHKVMFLTEVVVGLDKILV